MIIVRLFKVKFYVGVRFSCLTVFVNFGKLYMQN